MNTSRNLLLALTTRQKELQKNISAINTKLKKLNALQGFVFVKDKKNHTEYYHQLTSLDSKRTYIKKDEIQLAKNLAQKCYYNEVLRDMKIELQSISQLLATYNNHNFETIYDKYKPSRKALISPIVIPDEEYAYIWQNTSYTSKGFRPDDTSAYYTNKEERVRSKSEINIANYLKDQNIPYKYECPIHLEKSIYPNPIYPDFTILNIRTRQIFYLEHLGKMDDIDYVFQNLPRIKNYEKNGILLGKQLLVTYETSDSALDMRIVAKLVKEFLI